MLTIIDAVLTPGEVAAARARLLAAAWEDGVRTAGGAAATVKHNLQLPDADPAAREIGAAILSRVAAQPLFISAALAERIHPPRFSLTRGGGHYGLHVDAALMVLPESRETLRTDLAATLFLADPASYDGGELEIEGPFGAQTVKLAAGDMVLYPASSLHRVTPVTRGERLAAFFWVQSAVPDEGARTLLFDLDQAVQRLTATLGADHGEIARLAHVYHNLLRRWARV